MGCCDDDPNPIGGSILFWFCLVPFAVFLALCPITAPFFWIAIWWVFILYGRKQALEDNPDKPTQINFITALFLIPCTCPCTVIAWCIHGIKQRRNMF